MSWGEAEAEEKYFGIISIEQRSETMKQSEITKWKKRKMQK